MTSTYRIRQFPAGVYSFCSSACVVSGGGNHILFYDSGCAFTVIDFYHRNVLFGFYLVCVSTGCKEYLFQLYIYSAILRGDVLLCRLGCGWCQMGHSA